MQTGSRGDIQPFGGGRDLLRGVIKAPRDWISIDCATHKRST
jgi:hypothetical protein